MSSIARDKRDHKQTILRSNSSGETDARRNAVTELELTGDTLELAPIGEGRQ
jgi:hypothetical protein